MGQDGSLVSEGRGRKKSNDTKTTTHLFPPADWRPAGLQAKATLARLLPILLVSMMLCDMEHHFGQLGSSVPAVSPLNLLSTPSLLAAGAGWGTEKAVMLYKHCSETHKTSACYQNSFGHKSKAQHHREYREESSFFSSQTQFTLILISLHGLGDFCFLVLCSSPVPNTEDTWLNARFHFTEWREMGTPRLNAKADQKTDSETCYLLWLLAYIG